MVRKKAEEQLQETKNMLSLLNDISEQTQRLDQNHWEKEIYYTSFPFRTILVSKWNMKVGKDQDYIKKIAAITDKAKSRNLNVLTQQGLLSDFVEDTTYVFITVEDFWESENCMQFPSGEYACLNLKERDLLNLRKITYEKGLGKYRYAFYLNTDIYDFCLDHPLHMMEVQCTNINRV